MLNNRKVLLINKKFQLSILAWFFLLSVSLISVFAIANWYFFENLIELGHRASIPADHVFYQFVRHQRAFLMNIYLIASGAVLILMVTGGLILSHRIAGPLHRLKKHLASQRRQDVSPVTFRQDDYFRDLEDAFNEFTKR